MIRQRRLGARITVSADGFRGPVLVRDDGPSDGPVLVLVHGFCGSAYWYDRVVAQLDDTFRIVRIDLLGHGGTGGAAADAPLQTRVLDAVLARLGVEHVTVVGHSFGADVAVGLAEVSARVDRTVIVCQAPDYSDVSFPRGNELMTRPVVGHVLHESARLASRVLGAAISLRPPRDPAARLLVNQGLYDFRALRTGMFRVVLAERRARLASRPLDEQARDSGKPLLVVAGSKDHFYGDRYVGRYEAVGARVEVLPESGHSPLVEDPQALARLLREFAASVPS